MPVLAGAEPFSHIGSTGVGVLLCHGFTGTPASMRPWGARLTEAGHAVRGPRLPGHGTTWQEMNRTRWQDWYGCVRTEFEALRAECESVFVFGQSMGGTLTLRIAQEFGPAVSGLALVNPSVTSLRRDVKLLPLLSRVVPSIKGVAGDIRKPGVAELSYSRVPVRAAASLAELWRLTRADLAKVTQPLLLAHSTVDHVVEPVNSEIVARGVSSTEITDLPLPDSFHVATLDNDAPLIFERSLEFIAAHTPAAAR
ncbi:esterase [Amycolatopsis antarctica]|uniref:Esterase n=1 Tax=Amycolatopsis antarctica TaxID=1854586 RepID=A0A263DAI7_9PSEU|nr:alpha/beta fold hydrolase [Amycolatopsis antarctica]OZM74537.1 esterase [Amycolatopsis antarctica]